MTSDTRPLTEDELARLAMREALHECGAYADRDSDPTRNRTARSVIESLAARGYALRDTPVADTAGIDAAWREAEAALPEGWYLTLGDWAPEAGQTPATRYEAFAQRYAARDSDDSFMERADTPAAALLALAAALRTPKPEGDR